MVTRKNFDQIALAVTVIMLAITILFMNGESLGLEVMLPSLGYETRLFDNTKVHTIDIIMDDWDSFIKNAQSEEYSPATVVIDGETFKYVGIRGKGNTSLSTVASLDSERYSFKIEFDQYDSGKSYYGLDKLALNNLIQDSTMMKDYLAYTMMNEFGVDTPLCSFVYITVNGEDWGLYLAVEGVEDAFLQRNYGADTGELYKPDSMSFGGGRGNGKEFNMSEFWKKNFEDSDSESDSDESEKTETAESGETNESPMQGGFGPGSGMPDMSGMPSMPGGDAPAGFDPSSMSAGSGRPEMPGGNGGGFGFGGMGSSDVELQYIDDDFDSYSNIWNNAKTDVSDTDKTRLINSLKKLSENEDIESVVDIEQVIRYFVVHNYVCNGDSYTGMMIHNYYLHEKDGKLSMIPWDYNLAFGTMQGTDATGTVNTPIDMPVTGGSSDRPMLNWIFESEEYTELYHQYFAEFLESVDAVGIIDGAYELIAPYVEKDPTAFYTYDEFEKGVETIRSFCALRSESIEQQLENGETTTDMHYADASSLTLSDMGSMNNGGPVGGRGEGRMNIGRGNRMQGPDGGQSGFPGFDPSQMPEGSGSGMPQPPEGFGPGMPQMSEDSGSGMPKMPEGFGSGMPQMQDGSETAMPQMPENGGSGMPQMPFVTGDEGSLTVDQEKSSITQDVCLNPDCETAGQAVPGEKSGNGTGGERPRRDDMGMMQPSGNGFSRGEDTSSDPKTTRIWLGVSALILCAGLITAKKFRD